MRTAPAPNIPPLPGMNPGVFIAGGGSGAGGGAGRSGGASGGHGGAGGEGGGDDASGDQRTAPDVERYPTCGTESHPVDVVTGRVFTHPTVDLALPGPLPLVWERSYSSSARDVDQGLGPGWSHSLGWFVTIAGRALVVWNHRGVAVELPLPEVSASALGPWGWVARREAWGFAVDAGDDVWRVFSAADDKGRRFALTAIEDRNRNRIALTYQDGRLVTVTDSAGRIIVVASTPEGRIANLLVRDDPAQAAWLLVAQYRYDDRGRLVRVADADGHAATYAYDDDHQLTRDTDRAGLSFCFRYDARGRGVEAWGEYAGGKDPSLADDAAPYLHTQNTRAKGIYHRKLAYGDDGYTEVSDTTETRRYFGNRHGTLDKAVAGGAVTSSRYDARGFEIEKTDPLGATTTWERDERGRELAVTDPLGRRTTIERDVHGLPVTLVDPAGGVSRVYRDERGNVEAFEDAGGAVTQYHWDERGLPMRKVDAIGAVTRYTYDAHGNLIEAIQPNGARWVFTYDAFGRCLSTKDPTGAETRFAYSNRGDLLAVHDAAGGVTRYAYDGERHVTEVVSPGGHRTRFTWGGFHKLCARQDANGHTVRLGYSREGELVSVTNEVGEEHRLLYDPAGRLIGEQTFDRRVLRYRNDLAGRPVRVENGAGEITDLTYDLAGQLTRRELDDETIEAFEYDARGELVRAINAAGEFFFDRDPLGRIVREVQRDVRGEEHWVESVYDEAGNRIGRKTSLGHTEQVHRDAMGARVTTLLDGEHRIEHTSDVLAREIARELPRGGIIESAFDPMGRLGGRRVRTPAPLRSTPSGEPEWIGPQDDGVTAATFYAYDADGELAFRNDRDRGITRYQYDPVGQLLAAVPENARAEVFRYDPAGNLFEVGANAPVRVYDKGNRLLHRGELAYEWDDDGRLARKTERPPDGDRLWTYAWSGAGLLRAVQTPVGHRVAFDYDPLGRRVGKRVHARDGLAWKVTEHVRYVWDGDVLVHEIQTRAGEPDGVLCRTYVFEDESFAPLAHRDAGAAWAMYVTDPIGVPCALTDDRGRLEAVLGWTAWGRAVPSALTFTTALRFPGQVADAETGLHFNRWRYYDPETGRFISHDPLELDGGPNAYAYCRNPVAWLDPFGLDYYAAWRTPGGVTIGRRLTRREATARLSNEDERLRDVYADSKAEAKSLARSAGRTCTKDPAHGRAGPGALPHFHPGGDHDNFGHVFYRGRPA